MAQAAGLAPDGRQIVWQPNSSPQRKLLSCPVFECFFGGARGGGKTDGMLGDWAVHASRYGSTAIGLMVRRTAVQLGETFERARVIFSPLGARFVGSPQSGGMAVTMPGGGRLTFAHLERDKDAEDLQGGSYTRVYVEEAGNFPSAAPIMKLMATLRSGSGVPCRMRLTGNPGGPGHHWLKSRYIDPAPMGLQIIVDPETSLERVFIPSKVTDNPAVGSDYINRIKMSGSPELVRAWLEGDWDVVAGAYFPEWDAARHVVAPIVLPDHWMRYRAFDWGSAHPFCCLWFAVSDGTIPSIARDALVVYREWYGSNGQPNVGLRIPADEIARGIVSRDSNDSITISVADPAIFASDGGPSISERMSEAGVYFTKADNKRIAGRGTMGGWDQLRARLVGLDGRPMLKVFSTCTNLIRTLPSMQHDPQRPEDLASDSDDHCFAADTLVVTGAGTIRIADLVGVDGLVRTVGGGLAPFQSCRLTKRAADVVRLTFDDGQQIVCTPDHRFMNPKREWVKAIDLTDTMRYDISCTSPSSQTRFRSFVGLATIGAGVIFKATEFASIVRSGLTSMATFLPVMTSTIMIATGQTMNPAISSFSKNVTTLKSTAKRAESDLLVTGTSGSTKRVFGTSRRKAELGIGRTGRTQLARLTPSESLWFVSNAGKTTKHPLSSLITQGSVMPIAEPARCVRVERLNEKQDVYCLTVPSTEAFLIGNGIVAHNCVDTLRYGCMARPWVQGLPEKPPANDTWARAFETQDAEDSWRTA